MFDYTRSKKFEIVKFKSQQKITEDHQRKTKEQYKALKQRIEEIQERNKKL